MTGGQTERQTVSQSVSQSDRPTDRQTNWPTNWLTGGTDRPSDWLTDWVNDLTMSLIGYLTDRQTDWPTDRPTDRLTFWLTDHALMNRQCICVSVCFSVFVTYCLSVCRSYLQVTLHHNILCACVKRNMIKSALLVLGFQVSQGIFLDCCRSASGKAIELYIVKTNECKWCFTKCVLFSCQRSHFILVAWRWWSRAS